MKDAALEVKQNNPQIFPVIVSASKPTPTPSPVPTTGPKEEVIESKDDDNDKESDTEDKTVAATFIKKPSKPKPKAADLWKKAGMNIRLSLNVPSNKGMFGVIKQAEAQGQLKPKIFNRNITKAISAMAKKQAEKKQKGNVSSDKTIDNERKPSLKTVDEVPHREENQTEPGKTTSNDDKIAENSGTNVSGSVNGEHPSSLDANDAKTCSTETKSRKLKKQQSADSQESSSKKLMSKTGDKPQTSRPRSASVTSAPVKKDSTDNKPRRQSIASKLFQN